MTFASKEGRESVMRLCRDLKATAIEPTMLCAASNGHEFILRLCHD